MRKALIFAFSILFLLIHIDIFAQTGNQSPAKNPVSFAATGLVAGNNQIIENKNGKSVYDSGEISLFMV